MAMAEKSSEWLRTILVDGILILNRVDSIEYRIADRECRFLK